MAMIALGDVIQLASPLIVAGSLKGVSDYYSSLSDKNSGSAFGEMSTADTASYDQWNEQVKAGWTAEQRYNYQLYGHKDGIQRDTYRFVKGSDGSVYYTDSHYGQAISPSGSSYFIKVK